jgi:hypothetical protein
MQGRLLMVPHAGQAVAGGNSSCPSARHALVPASDGSSGRGSHVPGDVDVI